MSKSLKSMHAPFYSLLFAFFLFQILAVHASRSSNEHSFARRSLVNGHKRRFIGDDISLDSGNLVEKVQSRGRKRQGDGLLDSLLDPVTGGLGDVVDGLGLGGSSSSLSSTTALVPAPTFSGSSSSTPSSSGSTSGSSTQPTSSGSTESSGTTEPTSGGSSPTETSSGVTSTTESTSGDAATSTTEPPSSTTTSTTSEDGGILSTIIGGLSSVLAPPPETTESSTTEPTSPPTSEPTSEPTSAPTSDSASDPVSTTDGTTESPSTPTSDPSSTEPTSTDGGILSSILGPVTSVLLPPSSAESSVEPTSQPTEAPSSQPSDAPSSQPTEPPSSSTTSEDGGIISSIISDLTSGVSSVFNPPSSTSDSASSEITPPPSSSVEPSSVGDGPSSSQPGSISEPPSSSSVFPSGPSSISGPSSEPSSGPSSGPSSEPSSGPSSVSGSSSISISFPGGDNNSSSSAISASDSDSFSSSFTPTATTTTPAVSFSVNSEFSFVLTESSLAFTSIPQRTSLSMSNPDEATTTFNTETAGSAAVAAATFSAAPLPSDLPSRIYPRNGYQKGEDVTGFTLISLLFNQELNWPFVATNELSSAQIFAYMPAILNTALGLPGDSGTKTWMLQVYQPSTYRGVGDANELGTVYLAYIPTNQVDTLAGMIKAPQSAFYTGVNDQNARALAVRINSGYSILSEDDPNGGDNGKTGGSGNNDSSNNTDRTRQDAIIGVVSTLGAIAVLVLAFLGYKWYQRRQEVAHRRLSDPVPGARPEGREFDQDSLGGQRRRSFYFAEDSLRGYQQTQPEEYSYSQYNQNGARTSPVGGMTQRRNVAPATISQPILRESSMNW